MLVPSPCARHLRRRATNVSCEDLHPPGRRRDDGFAKGRAPRKEPPASLELNGTIDEAQATLGVARAECEPGDEFDRFLLDIERNLWTVMAAVAATPHDEEVSTRNAQASSALDRALIADLETLIDDLGSRFSLPRDFTVPGVTRRSAALDPRPHRGAPSRAPGERMRHRRRHPRLPQPFVRRLLDAGPLRGKNVGALGAKQRRQNAGDDSASATRRIEWSGSKLRVKRTDQGAEALAIPVFQDLAPANATFSVDAIACARRGFAGKLGETLIATAPSGALEVLVGLGARERVDLEALRRAAAAFTRAASHCRILAVDTDGLLAVASDASDAPAVAQALVEGGLLAPCIASTLNRRVSPTRRAWSDSLCLAATRCVAGSIAPRSSSAPSRLALDLINRPPSMLTPVRFAGDRNGPRQGVGF